MAPTLDVPVLLLCRSYQESRPLLCDLLLIIRNREIDGAWSNQSFLWRTRVLVFFSLIDLELIIKISMELKFSR